jgi:hypothetical protein
MGYHEGDRKGYWVVRMQYSNTSTRNKDQYLMAGSISLRHGPYIVIKSWRRTGDFISDYFQRRIRVIGLQLFDAELFLDGYNES